MIEGERRNSSAVEIWKLISDQPTTSPWAEAVGILYRPESFAAVLGWTTGQVLEAAKNDAVFSVVVGDDGPLFPAGQLGSDGAVLPVVGRILARFSAAEVDAVTLAAWLNTPKESLGGRSVWDSLDDEPRGSAAVWTLIDEFVRRSSQ